MSEREMRVPQYIAVIDLVIAGDFAPIPLAFSADELQIEKPTPVVAWTMKSNATPNYLTGIGHVQAYNTVVVRSQVEGQILRLDFAEGQAVHRGDLLAEVDPRPFQVRLDDAVASRNRIFGSCLSAMSRSNRSTSRKTRSRGSPPPCSCTKPL